MLGKKHRIRTYSAEQMNEALSAAGILPIHKNEEITQIDSDEQVVPSADINRDIVSEETCTDCTASDQAQVNDEL